MTDDYEHPPTLDDKQQRVSPREPILTPLNQLLASLCGIGSAIFAFGSLMYFIGAFLGFRRDRPMTLFGGAMMFIISAFLFFMARRWFGISGREAKSQKKLDEQS
ncbi:MAG TPA: hypothetical protein PK402_03030 [Tepidisphaeraceae bacterium]|nr:hypothetical protein [Tepidisphaeraceae bacterium]